MTSPFNSWVGFFESSGDRRQNEGLENDLLKQVSKVRIWIRRRSPAEGRTDE